MTERVFGTDTSHWTGLIDFKQMASRGVKFNITKGSDYAHATKLPFVDVKAAINTQRAKEAGILTGLYHWLQQYADGREQYWYHRSAIYDKVQPDFPVIMDFEEQRAMGNNDYLFRAQQFLELAEANDPKGREPIVYTGEWFLRSFNVNKLKFLGRYPLWFARYISPSNDPFRWRIGYKPVVNQIWNTWTIWQYSSSGNAAYYGTQGAVDENLFNGSAADLDDFLKRKHSVYIPVVGAGDKPEPEPVKPAVGMRVEVVYDFLRKRTSPLTGNNDTGKRYMRGDTFTVTDVAGSDAWVRAEDGTWSAFTEGGSTYLKVVR